MIYINPMLIVEFSVQFKSNTLCYPGCQFIVMGILSLFGELDHFCYVHLKYICLNTDLRLEIFPHYLLFIQ